jgi:hypothetical protein
MKIGDGTTTYTNLNTNYTRNNDINILDFGAKADFIGPNTGTDSITPIANATTEVRTINPAFSKTLVLPSGNFRRTIDPFIIPNNCFTQQDYGNVLTADITVGGTGATGTPAYNIPMSISAPDQVDGNLLYKTYSDGASRNMEYTGRVISGLIDRGTQGGNLGGANGTAMNMFDIRYDNAFIGNKTAVTIGSVAADTETFNVTMTGLTKEGQPIIFNDYIGVDKIVAGRQYYIHSVTNTGAATTSFKVRNTLLNAAPVLVSNPGGAITSLTGYTLSGAGNTTINGNTANSSNMTFTGGTTPVVGQPITFRGNVTRAITPGVTYFVNSVSGSTITVRRSRTGTDLVRFSATPTLSVVADLGTIVSVTNMPTSSTTITMSTSPSNAIPIGTPLVFDSPVTNVLLSNFRYYIITPSGSPTTTITISRTPPQAVITGITAASYTATANIWVSKGDDFIHAVQGRIITNSREAGGGRIAISGYVQQDAVSSTGSNARNYVGCGGFTTTNSGDNGGDLTAAGSKGAYFGGNFIAKATAGTNMFNLCGVEVNAENVTGATSRYVSGVASVGAVAQPGSVLTAAYTAGGLTEGGTTHLGWVHGLCFTDLNGRDAMRADGTLIGTYLENSGSLRRTIANVIDVSTFRPTASVITTPNLTLTESQLTLGVPQGSTTSTITTNGQRYANNIASTYGAAGANNDTNTITDASIEIKSRGTGSAILSDSATQRLFVNSTNGIVFTPLVTNTVPALTDGQLSMRINSGATGMVFTYKPAGGAARTAVIALA